MQFITPVGPWQSLPSQGPWPTFVKSIYTCVLLKPTSPNSLNLAWKVLKRDIIRLQPWLIIRRVSWLYIVAYTNRCHKDYKGDWLHRGLLHSFWRREILVWNPVFINREVQSSLKVQDGVSLACSFPPSDSKTALAQCQAVSWLQTCHVVMDSSIPSLAIAPFLPSVI